MTSKYILVYTIAVPVCDYYALQYCKHKRQATSPRELPSYTVNSPHNTEKLPSSGILTTWYKRVYTCLKHVCTSYVQCLSTAADRHGIYKNEKSCTCFKHVHIFLQIHVHVCTWYVHGGLFLHRSAVLRHIRGSKPCFADNLGFQEKHVEARAGDVMAGAGGAAGPAPDVRHQPPGKD
jgi:hypothetical protein